MKISVSNIAWDKKSDAYVYTIMKEFGFGGLEIAPTRVFPLTPYERLDEAKAWAKDLWKNHGLIISSMQSILYGRPEKIFGSDDERQSLLNYTKKAVDFAEAVGCGNLVFGCPHNRVIPDNGNIEIAVSFFWELGEYANEHNTVLSVEANPPIYNTNFLNTTKEAIDFIERVGSKGLMLNLDMGTIIENGEDFSVFKGKEHLINHVHISEPGLKEIKKRSLHMELADALRDINYQKFVSIEAGRQDDMRILSKMMEYVAEIFG